MAVPEEQEPQDAGAYEDVNFDDNFRFYERELPEIDDLVHVQVKRVTDACAYVALSEYGGTEGMILLAELSTKRIRSLQKEIRVGQYDVMMVLKAEGRSIELSKRRVQPEEKKKFIEKYASAKLVQSVLKHISRHENMPMQPLCEKISWPLYKSEKSSPITVFKAYVNNHDSSWCDALELGENVQKELLAEVKRRLAPQAARLKAQIEVGCPEFEGVNAVKAALLAGEKAANTDPSVNPVHVKVVSAPLYEIVTTSMGMAAGLARIEVCLQAIETSITEANGTFLCKSKPELVTEQEQNVDDNEDESSDDDEEASDFEGMPDIEH